MPETGAVPANLLHEFLRGRRSVRRFTPDPIPQEALNRILETARWAPSSHNSQPWRFAVVARPEAKERLAAAMGADFLRDLLSEGVPQKEARAQVARSQGRITGAPLAVVLCLTTAGLDMPADINRRRPEFRMAMQSVALAGGTLMLAAHAEGLGSVWICAPLFAQQTVQAALDLPADWEPQGMLLIGHPAVRPPARERRPLSELTRYL